MSDIDDLDEEELNRQLAELGEDIDSEDLDLSDLEGLEDEDAKPDFDEERYSKQIDKEIAELVGNSTGSELCNLLKKRLKEVLIKNDGILQSVAKKEAEFGALKKEMHGRRDLKIIELEEELDSLQDLLEDEEREGANMYNVYKRSEKELTNYREECNKLNSITEQRSTQHQQTMKRLQGSIKKCKAQISEHEVTLFNQVTKLTDDLRNLETENEKLEEENKEKELKVEELLRRRDSEESQVSNKTASASELRVNQEKQLEDLNNQYTSLISSTEKLESENKDLRQKLDEITRKFREVKRKQTTITIDHDEAERDLKKREREAKTQEDQIAKLEAEVEDLRQQRRKAIAGES